MRDAPEPRAASRFGRGASAFNLGRGTLRRLSLATLLLLALASVPAGCQRGAIEPVEIAPEDACAFCRMVISEKRYAAEFIDVDGEAYKFDDITCMGKHAREKLGARQIAARFVVDYEARRWVKAEDAYYVRSSELKTPMSGGVVAFKDEAQAREAAANYHGQLLRFADVFAR
jgi:copper chaperone NosL